MATVLNKRFTENDTAPDLLAAIIRVAEDKNTRLLKDDQIEWLEIKLGEIARLAKILKKKKNKE